MSVEAAAADRLPWLADEPVPKPVNKRRGGLFAWAAALAAIVAAGGFWIGQRSVQAPASLPSRHAQSSMTVRLPPPRPVGPAEVRIPAEREVRQAQVPEVHPSPVREVRIPSPPAERSRPVPPSKAKILAKSEKETPEVTAQTSPVTATSKPAEDFVVPKPWNPRVVEGAAGRLVQVGAFGSIHQAKRGWWFMVHDYPAMAHLPAVVRQTRNSRGRTFYRFDVGTTSQAHSEVLCQRMTKVGLSCAVIGLPWKAKVER